MPGNDRDAQLPPTLGDVVLMWLTRTSVVALGLSLLVHVFGWLIASFVVVGHSGGRGGEGSGDGEGVVEMAVMTEAELAGIEGGSIGVDTPSVPDGLVEATPELAGIMGGGLSDDAGGGTVGDIGEAGYAGGGGDIGSGGDGIGLGGAGGGGASFFGVEASGNRFAYIVDVSTSMEGIRIEALRRELARSLNALLETSQFMVVKYSTESTILGDSGGWQEASPNVKRKMGALISALEPEATTVPVPAFGIVFGKKPRPDAIYFMTDGEFSDAEVEQVLAMNKPYKVPIHCICLGGNEGEARMKKIAKATKGTYTYVRLN